MSEAIRSVHGATTADSSATRIRGVHPPRQSRSQVTLERIIDATERLLDGRAFEHIPVTEICNEAGVSESSFYARFSTKDAVLRTLHDRHIRRRKEFIGSLAKDIDWDALELSDLVRNCLRLYLEDRVANAPLLRSLYLAQMQHRSLLDQRLRLDLDGLVLIESYVCNRLGDDSEALRQRIRFATRSAVAVVHDSVASPHHFADQLRWSHEEIVAQAADQWMHYVTGSANLDIVLD